jgi:aminoglycoside 6'-N-acetyltransferase
VARDAPPTLRGERLTLRPAVDEDVPALVAMLAEPEVASWWGRHDAARVRAELPGTFAIVVDGELRGWLHVSEETDPDYRHVGFDIALASAAQGRGLGPEALLLAIRHYAARGHHRFTIDPAAHNERAIRAYARIGFKPVGVMRRYERGPDGTWHDGLLMDLLADELRP